MGHRPGPARARRVPGHRPPPATRVRGGRDLTRRRPCAHGVGARQCVPLLPARDPSRLRPDAAPGRPRHQQDARARRTCRSARLGRCHRERFWHPTSRLPRMGRERQGPGFSPRGILDEAARTARYSADEVAALHFAGTPPRRVDPVTRLAPDSRRGTRRDRRPARGMCRHVRVVGRRGRVSRWFARVAGTARVRRNPLPPREDPGRLPQFGTRD